MCRHGAPRFAAWVRLPWGEEFLSASPELFFETRGRRIRTEPMKGTARPDAAGALESSEKDRAELAMITDLLRNDLTKVCRPRSVAVACERRVIQLLRPADGGDIVGGGRGDAAGRGRLPRAVWSRPPNGGAQMPLEATPRRPLRDLGLIDAAATFALRSDGPRTDGWAYGGQRNRLTRMRAEFVARVNSACCHGTTPE
jgi:hypothetical protein